MSKISPTLRKRLRLSCAVIFLFSSLITVKFLLNLRNQQGYQSSHSQQKEYQAPDLKTPIQQWLSSLPPQSKTGLIIYDLTLRRNLIKHNENDLFPLGELQSLLLGFEGYTRLTNQTATPDTLLENVQMQDCLHQIFRTHSPKHANLLADYINLINFEHINTSRYQLENTTKNHTTPADMIDMLKIIHRHLTQTDQFTIDLKKHLLGQAVSPELRIGLPTGLEVGQIIHLGSYRNLDPNTKIIPRHDLVIFSPRFGRPSYLIAVLSENLDSDALVRLGKLLKPLLTAQ